VDNQHAYPHHSQLISPLLNRQQFLLTNRPISQRK
jgi:hypothetical protein